MTTKEKIQRTLEAAAGKHLGDIVWSEINEVDGQKYSRTSIGDMLVAEGLQRELIADKISAQGALGRARRDCDTLYDRYTVQTAKKRDTTFHVFRSEGGGTNAKKVTCATASISSSSTLVITENLSNIDSKSQMIVAELRSRFAHHLDFATHRDVSRMVTRTIKALSGTRLRRTGSLFWVPASHNLTLRRFSNVVEALGSCELNAMPVYDTKESKATAGRAMRSGIDAEMQGIASKLVALRQSNNTTRESTVERKLDECGELQMRIDLLVDVLGDRAVKLKDSLAVVKADALVLLNDVKAGKKGKAAKPRKTKPKAEKPKKDDTPTTSALDVDFD